MVDWFWLRNSLDIHRNKTENKQKNKQQQASNQATNQPINHPMSTNRKHRFKSQHIFVCVCIATETNSCLTSSLVFKKNAQLTRSLSLVSFCVIFLNITICVHCISLVLMLDCRVSCRVQQTHTHTLIHS